jgi:hypothetical protein
MTMIETETISCPACNTQQETTVYQTINAMENPELVQKLMKGEINLFKCARCGHEALIESPLLYNDYRIGLKIQFYPEHVLKENPGAVCNDYLAMLKQLEKLREDFSPFPKETFVSELGSVAISKELIDEMGFAVDDKFEVRKTKTGISLKQID